MIHPDTYRAYQRLLWRSQRRPLEAEEIAQELYEAEFDYGPSWQLLEERYRTEFIRRAESIRPWLSNPRSFRRRRLQRFLRRRMRALRAQGARRELHARFWGRR